MNVQAAISFLHYYIATAASVGIVFHVVEGIAVAGLEVPDDAVFIQAGIISEHHRCCVIGVKSDMDRKGPSVGIDDAAMPQSHREATAFVVWVVIAMRKVRRQGIDADPDFVEKTLIVQVADGNLVGSPEIKRRIRSRQVLPLAPQKKQQHADDKHDLFHIGSIKGE